VKKGQGAHGRESSVYRRRRRGEKRGGGEGGSRAPALMFAGRGGDCCALRLRSLWLEMNAVPLS
jgi:hypothetical protein